MIIIFITCNVKNRINKKITLTFVGLCLRSPANHDNLSLTKPSQILSIVCYVLYSLLSWNSSIQQLTSELFWIYQCSPYCKPSLSNTSIDGKLFLQSLLRISGVVIISSDNEHITVEFEMRLTFLSFKTSLQRLRMNQVKFSTTPKECFSTRTQSKNLMLLFVP